MSTYLTANDVNLDVLREMLSIKETARTYYRIMVQRVRDLEVVHYEDFYKLDEALYTLDFWQACNDAGLYGERVQIRLHAYEDWD